MCDLVCLLKQGLPCTFGGGAGGGGGGGVGLGEMFRLFIFAPGQRR